MDVYNCLPDILANIYIYIFCIPYLSRKKKRCHRCVLHPSSQMWIQLADVLSISSSKALKLYHLGCPKMFKDKSVCKTYIKKCKYNK